MEIGHILTIVIAVLGFVLAALLGRWRVLFVPLFAWLIFFLGLEARWWGNESEFGDGWILALVFETIVGVAAVALGMAARWLVLRLGRWHGHRIA